MLKKSAIIVTSLVLGLSISQADDEVKKPVVEEVKKPDAPAKTSKSAIPDKKIEEFTNEELIKAGSYINGVMLATQVTQNKEFDTKSFLQAIEDKIKTPSTPYEKSEWDQLVEQYKELKKDKKDLTPEFAAKFFRYYGLFISSVVPQNGMNLGSFVDGFKEKIANKDFAIPEETMKNIMEKLQPILAAVNKANADKAKLTDKVFIESKKFLDENMKKEGVKTLPSGLQYKIIKAGEGALPTDDQTINVNYVGTTIDGKVFDSSAKSFQGKPFPVEPPRNVITGWKEALKLMNKGSKWQVFIPEDLAYGERGAGADIKPFAALIFEIEVLDFVGGAAVAVPPKKAD